LAWALGLIALLLICLVVPHPALATRLSDEHAEAVHTILAGATIRLDGAAVTSDGRLFVLLMPAAGMPRKGKAEVDEVLPDRTNPQLVLYSNGCAHVFVEQKGTVSYPALTPELAARFKKQLQTWRFPSDLIVPEGFVLPKSLKSLARDLTIPLIDDASMASGNFTDKQPATRPGSAFGTVFCTSIAAGMITMLDGKTLNKVAEFPTEGTPCSMEAAGGKLFITDQTKGRVLILDPGARRFLGQIDLHPRSAPRGIAALPNGQWLYVSENALSAVAVIETATGKVLLRTKVHSGPGRMAVTPDANFVVVLNAPSGEATIIATYNQQVVATVKVGAMPVSVAIAPDSKTAYISNRASNTVSVLDIARHAITGTIKTGSGPCGLVVTPDGKKLYVAIGRENLIVVYDTGSLVKLNEVHITDCEFPGCICLLPDATRLLVASQQSDAVGVIDTNTLEFKKLAPLGHPINEAVWEPLP
jgi:YVTN family beta-propeller protein